jgi:hypothetical protein
MNTRSRSPAQCYTTWQLDLEAAGFEVRGHRRSGGCLHRDLDERRANLVLLTEPCTPGPKRFAIESMLRAESVLTLPAPLEAGDDLLPFLAAPALATIGEYAHCRSPFD